MTRARKLTLSMKEFSHLVSESLDIAIATSPPHPFVENTTVFSEPAPKHRSQPSSFQRIFSRPTPTPGQHEDSPHGATDDFSDSPRKMISWPFSRSPRKLRPTRDEDYAIREASEPCHSDPYHSPYAITSLAAASTSSLGSLVPVHERLFQVTSLDSDEPNQSSGLFSITAPSPAARSPSANELPTSLDHSAVADSLHAIFGNGSATSVLDGSDRSVVEPASDISNQTRTSLEGTEASHSLANSEPESADEDPTPRVSSFGPQAPHPPTQVRDNPLHTQRGQYSQRLSLIVPSQNVDTLALRPAVGATPHAPSETDSTISMCTSSPTSTVARGSSPTFPSMGPSSPGASPRVPPSTPPNLRTSAILPSNVESPPTLGIHPRSRKSAMSRSMTPPPLPRPPPTGPLPAVPSSIPPVPPLPSLLNKITINMTSHPVQSPPRSIIPTNPTTGLPPSPPGGLRLPSRLSWVNGVRAILPSPPASPTKSLKSLTGKTPHPVSPSKAEKTRSNELKRPTSIGVIEAADCAHVRRTKSILLLGSRSKSNTSLGTKRVQIHADVNLDTAPSRKPRRKSSAATVGRPTSSSETCLAITPMPSAELLVLRERRHSAPILSSLGRDVAGASADWTLSLPFCTDVPGNKILPSPLLTPQLKSECGLEEVQGEDWTLCMPLKVRVGTPTIEGCDSEYTLTGTSETIHTQTTMQLPTPSPSPTCSTHPSIIQPLDPEECVSIPEERPATPASLGPHVGGLDLVGGRGKRASGWHVYGWFDEVSVSADERDVEVAQPTTPVSVSDDKNNRKLVKNHITVFRKEHDASGRHPSQDSMSTVSTSETMFYSARSSLLVS